MGNIHYVVPARKGSKGFPLKNRKLIKHLDCESFKESLIVYSDDPWITNYCAEKGYKHVNRPSEVSLDETSPRDTIIRLCNDQCWSPNDTIVMLYLTYPERTGDDIQNALDFYQTQELRSLLCRKELAVSPYLMMREGVESFKGEQLVKHDYYRRQDYPSCFEISHYVCIFQISELQKLNNNLYNKETAFYPIKNVIDVDALKDYEKYEDNS